MNNKGFVEIIAILIMILVFAIIGYAVYSDVSFGTKRGTVIDKRYNAQWISYTTSTTSNGSINIPVAHPESYQIKIKKDNKELWIDVDSNTYNNINIGDCYQCNEVKDNE